jgi:hypothetical protein
MGSLRRGRCLPEFGRTSKDAIVCDISDSPGRETGSNPGLRRGEGVADVTIRCRECIMSNRAHYFTSHNICYVTQSARVGDLPAWKRRRDLMAAISCLSVVRGGSGPGFCVSQWNWGQRIRGVWSMESSGLAFCMSRRDLGQRISRCVKPYHGVLEFTGLRCSPGKGLSGLSKFLR